MTLQERNNNKAKQLLLGIGLQKDEGLTDFDRYKLTLSEMIERDEINDINLIMQVDAFLNE